ncbi:MAG: hypothetical protein J6V44_09150 [Methanobrevibacter sp.]|nr:hypothetical protein [Methanobrevibacter sp.]
MFDKHIYQSSNTQYVPYCKEVNHTYNVPTTSEQISQLNEMREKLKEDLLKVFVMELKPLDFEALVSCWKSDNYIGNETQITIKKDEILYHKNFHSPYISNKYTESEYMEKIKEKTEELLKEIFISEYIKITRTLQGEIK